MKTLRALDLFCGAGGVAMGLHHAGFDVVGVDLNPQPRFPFEFVQMSALDVTVEFIRAFDFVWASPPCQFGTAMKTMHNAKEHMNLIPDTRELVLAAGIPYTIENVEGAREHLRNPVKLCGTMFGLGVDGAELLRHRYFESSFAIPQRACQHGLQPATIGVYGGHVRNRKRREGSHARGVADFTPDQGRKAMGIDWMSLTELSEAIPPAYAEYIGLAARMAILTGAGTPP